MILGLAISLVAFVPHAQGLTETTAATRTAVRLRERPDTGARVVTRLPAKTSVYVTSCANGWCQVSFEELSGYVPNRSLVVVRAQTETATPHQPIATVGQFDAVQWTAPTVTSQDLWKVVHSPAGSAPYTILQLDAIAPVRGPVLDIRPSLNVICREHRLQVYLMTQSIMLADSGSHTPVLLYWGLKRPPFEVRRWIVSTDHTAAFARKPVTFVNRLLTSSDLGIEFGLYDELARTASFNVRGLRAHLAELEEGCPCYKGITWTRDRCSETLESADTVYGETELDQRPAVLSGPALEYPRELKALGIEGQVIVEAIIDTTGHAEPESVHLVHGANPEFDSAAEHYVRDALFRPARLHGKAVRALINLPINFRVPRP